MLASRKTLMVVLVVLAVWLTGCTHYRAASLGVLSSPVVNTLDEAVALVREVGSPSLATMLDAKSAALAEAASAPDLLDRWLPEGVIRHVQLNDRNRRGPGQGSDRIAPIVGALLRGSYDGDIAIEPFEYVPDGPACAARAAGYVRGLLEALSPSR